MALEADRFIGYVLGTQHDKLTTDDHPLASWVITRPFTDLLAWPFTRSTPSPLAGVAKEKARRGPVTSGPSLRFDEREHFFEHLKAAAERADVSHVEGLLLRRQAHYVAGFDDSRETADWLATMQRGEERRTGHAREWTPSWAVIRSGAHSLARLGDREGLRHFIRTRLADDVCEMANLNYWAYWLGEVNEPQTTDLFMVELTSEAWQGGHLFRHLTSKLHGANPYVDVVAHTLWALVMLRPSVLNQRAARNLDSEAAQMLDEGRLSSQSRRELEAVVYALRMINRS